MNALDDLDPRQLLGRQQANPLDDLPIEALIQPSQPIQKVNQQEEPSFGQKLVRQLGLTGRAIGEGIVDLAAPFADPLAGLANKVLEATGSSYRFPEQSQAFSNALTKAGVPTPNDLYERISNIGGRFLTGTAANIPLVNALKNAIPSAPQGFQPINAKTEAGKILQKNQIPLDKGQATDNPLLKRVSSALKDNPITTGKEQQFNQTQQKAFNRAVLRSVGVDSDSASQSAMAEAKQKIGRLYDQVGKNGAFFDNQLQSDIGNIEQNANSTVLNIKPLKNNIEDILNAVDSSGKINGQKFIQIRSNLSDLSKKPDVGPVARQLHDALIGALERSNPKDAEILAQANQQWRVLKNIETAIDKGLSGYISPLRLSNAIAAKAQRNASIYGIGGDQDLISLAKAGREILPDTLPNSGTVPRGLMQAPIRSIMTGLPMKPLQAWMLSQPGMGINGKYILPSTSLLSQYLMNQGATGQ